MTPQPHHSRGSLSPSLEHYLRAIFDLQESKGYARVTDIASMLGVAKPAVSAAVKTLRSNGLVSHRIYESILLTEEGAKRAKGVSGKFSILMHFLTDVLGVEEAQAFVDACVMEHYVSGNSIDRLARSAALFRRNRAIRKFWRNFISFAARARASTPARHVHTIAISASSISTI